MLNKYKGIIFDLDGTLIDSMGLWEDIDRIYLKKFGYDLPEDLKECIEGKSFHETADYFKQRFELDDSVESIKNEWHMLAEEFYKEKVTMKESAQDLLIQLKEMNLPIAIATSNSRELAMMALKKNGIQDYFHSIVTSCDVDKGKPEPDVFLEAARKINIVPEECLVFEDTYAGMLGAKRAGMTVVAVYDHFSRSNTSEIKKISDYYILKFNEVL